MKHICISKPPVKTSSCPKCGCLIHIPHFRILHLVAPASPPPFPSSLGLSPLINTLTFWLISAPPWRSPWSWSCLPQSWEQQMEIPGRRLPVGGRAWGMCRGWIFKGSWGFTLAAGQTYSSLHFAYALRTFQTVHNKFFFFVKRDRRTKSFMHTFQPGNEGKCGRAE